MEKFVVNTFLDLVKIDSPSGYENNIREYLSKRLALLGSYPEIDNRGNLFGKIDGVGEPSLLCAHMDTVEPGRGVNPVMSGDVIKSKGKTILGADNKVAVAAILEALNFVDVSKRRALEIIFSVCEETNGGINKFNFDKLKSKSGIVADSSNPVGTIILSAPWIEELKIEVLGLAAHAGRPENGINALTVVTKAMNQLKWGRVDDETTSNIGLIRGGQATNTIPDRILLEGEVRSFSKMKLERNIKKINKVFSYETQNMKAKLIFKSELYCPGYNHSTADVAEIVRAINKTGIRPRFDTTFGGSDANTFNLNGIKVVNIGDGTMNTHTVNESISVKDLVNLTKVIINYITV